MKIVFILFSFALIFSQSEIVVYKSKSNIVMSFIEDDIIKSVISLYNSKNKDKMTLRFRLFDDFSTMMDVFKEMSTQKKNIIAIDMITITEERKKHFIFSSKYMPTKDIYVKRRSDSRSFELNKDRVIGYMKNTIYETEVLKLKEKYQTKIASVTTTTNLYESLESKRFDYVVVDNISIWEKPTFIPAADFGVDKNKGFGFMYPKSSKLKSKLDKYLMYYMKSARFKKLLARLYSDEVSNYFIKAMFKK